MRSFIVSCLIILSALCLGCSGQNSQFADMAGSVLGSTGLVSDSQARSLFKAGGSLAKAAQGFSAEQEHFIGRGVSAHILSQYPANHSPNLGAYLSKVGQVVAANSERPYTFSGYHFQVVQSAELNAMAAPGGFIFVTSGLLKLLPDEDTLAAVLAHEVSHVVLGHGVKAIGQKNVSQALLLLGQEAALSSGGTMVSQVAAAFGDSVNDVVGTVLVRGYGRSQEYAADKMATEILSRAGYNPYALVTVLDILEKQAAHAGSSGLFATHPSPEDRKDEVLDEIDEGHPVIVGQQDRAKRFQSSLRGLA